MSKNKLTAEEQEVVDAEKAAEAKFQAEADAAQLAAWEAEVLKEEQAANAGFGAAPPAAVEATPPERPLYFANHEVPADGDVLRIPLPEAVAFPAMRTPIGNPASASFKDEKYPFVAAWPAAGGVLVGLFTAQSSWTGLAADDSDLLPAEWKEPVAAALLTIQEKWPVLVLQFQP